MTASGGSRLSWASLPGWLRDSIGDLVGSPVLSAVSQAGGFSRGSADRLLHADGTRTFVKAVDASTDTVTLGMHRNEARIAAVLPTTLPAPAFLGVVDEDDWVALCFADVGGRQPETPWRDADVRAVLDLLWQVAATRVNPSTLPHPAAEIELAYDLAGFERLGDRPAGLNPVAAAHLDELQGGRAVPRPCAREKRCAISMSGPTTC